MTEIKWISVFKRLAFFVSALMFFLLLFPLNSTNIILILCTAVLVTALTTRVALGKNIKNSVIALIFTVLVTIILYRNYLGIYLTTQIDLIQKICSVSGLTYETIIRIVGIVSVAVASAFEYIVAENCLDRIEVMYRYIDHREIREIIKKNFKKLPKDLIRSSVIVLVSICAGFLLLLSVFSMPVDRIEDNVEKTAFYIQSEGMYPKLFPWCTSRMDNSTDSIMLLEAADQTGISLIEKAMLVNRSATEPSGSYFSLIDHYVNQIPITHKISYPRYWHGYLVFIKPLLALADFSVIRGLNLLGQTIVTLTLMYLLYDNGKKKYILPYAVSLLLIMPYAISRCMQFSSCYYLMQVFSIFILMGAKKQRELLFVFLFAGIATAYFDFLTYPIAVFSLPAVFAMIVSDEESIEEKAVNIVRFFAFWAAGYVLMWSSKWILASIFTDENVIADAFHSILFRVSDISEIGAESFNGFEVLFENLSKFFYTPFTFVYFVIFAFYLIKARKTVYEKRIVSYIPYLILMLFPILWLMIIKNHSMIHAYFTNKSLMVSAFAILSMLVSATEVE